MTEPHSYEELIVNLGSWMMKHYWGPMWKMVSTHPQLVSVIPGFLIHPTQLIFYLGRTHIGIEYVGPERLEQLPPSGYPLEAKCVDCSLEGRNLLENIIGFDYGPGIKMPLTPISSNLVLPTNAGIEELVRLKWNWAAQDMVVGINSGGVMVPEGQFTRIVNGRFFDADQTGLKTRYIRWLDLIPCQYDDSGETLDSFRVDLSAFERLAEVDPLKPFPLPEDFRLERLQKVNRFIEQLGDRTLTEPQITTRLADPQFRFILNMRFAALKSHPQLRCEWQSGTRDPIQPDFFVEGTDGFADIVEFKLPDLKGTSVVGRANREAFSAEINSYIAQTRVYRDYFDDPRNRDYVKQKYGFEVYKPRRILVVGRRWNFDSADWRAIAADYSDLTIMTYDDLIDGVVTQFFN